jgi:hypothetical protein
MRMSRTRLLAARRGALVAQSDVLRARLLLSALGLHRSAGVAQLGAEAARALVRHPGALVAAGVAVMTIGPRRLLRLAAAGIGLWSLWGRVRRVVSRLALRMRSTRP